MKILKFGKRLCKYVIPELKLPVKIMANVVVFEDNNITHRFACLMVDRATSSFGPFDVLNREGSQSSAIYGCIENRK